MGLAAGLAHSGSQRLDRPYEPTHIVGYAYDGTRSNRSDLLIDGAAEHRPPPTPTRSSRATSRPPTWSRSSRSRPRPSTPSSATPKAASPASASSPGTNRFHGSVYYFAEPVSLAANDFFGKARGQERVDGSSDPARVPRHRPGPHPGALRRPGQDVLLRRLRAHQGRAAALRRRRRRRGCRPRRCGSGDFSAFSSEHHDLRSADPRPHRQRAVRRPAVPGQRHPGQPDQPRGADDPRLLLAAQGRAGLSGNIFDSTLPETADYDTTTVRLDQQVASNNRMFVRGSWYKRDSNYNEYFGNTEADGTLFQFISYQADDRRRPHLQPHDRPERPLRLEPLRAQLGPAARRPELRPHEAGLPRGDTTRLIPEVDRRFPRLDFAGDTHGRRGLRRRLPADHLAHGRRHAQQVALLAHAEGRRGDADLPRGQPVHGQRQRSGRYTFNNTYTRQNSASGTRLQRPAGLRRRSSWACPPPRRSCAPRTTPNTRRPGASSCRTTGGSTTS